MTIKQHIGKIIFKNLPFSRHVFDHLRLELNAIYVRVMHKISPIYLVKVARLKRKNNLLVNIGCGPYGLPTGWVNLDLFKIRNVYLRVDCRKILPLSNNSCQGIHVEMFLEHLDPVDELPYFLESCYSSLEKEGILRIVVPDANKFLHAYFDDNWNSLNQISYGKDDWAQQFSTKMDALNHVFLQGYEHYGGWDRSRLEFVLRKAGFVQIKIMEYNVGEFPGGPIDREYHKDNGLYVEAKK